MRSSSFLGLGLLAALFGIGLSTTAHAQTDPVFPADDEWVVLNCGGVPSYDPLKDEPGANGEKDVVGDSTDPALYYYYDGTYLYFRMRVDGDPGMFDPFGWAVEFDTDGDFTTYELLVQVNGIDNPDAVTLHQNTMQNNPDDPADPAELELSRYAIPPYARSVMATSNFGGDPDYFVDWAVPLADLMAYGVTSSSQLMLAMGTSSNTQSINADLACNDGAADPQTLSRTFTDPVVTDPTMTLADCDGDGLTDAQEMALGTDPCVADTDGDGCTDWQEVRAGSDPLLVDTDGDGFPDCQEITANSDPTDPASQPQVALRGGGGPIPWTCSVSSGVGAKASGSEPAKPSLPLAPIGAALVLGWLFARRRSS